MFLHKTNTLKTMPRKDGTAPLAWYVGSSTAPERRFVEHAFSSTPIEAFPSESGVGAAEAITYSEV